MIKIIYTDPQDGRTLEMYVSKSLYVQTLNEQTALSYDRAKDDEF